MIRPSADALAQMVVELPSKLITILIFDLILYFIGGLQTELGSQFFVFFLFTSLATLAMIAIFRTIGAWCSAGSLSHSSVYFFSNVFAYRIGRNCVCRHTYPDYCHLYWLYHSSANYGRLVQMAVI